MAFTNDSSKLLVAVKAYARGNALPLDNSEIYASKAEAEVYAASATAYAGQTIKVLEDGKYITYVLDPKDEGGFALTRVGVDESVVADVNELKESVATAVETLETQGETLAEHTTAIANNKKAIEEEIARAAEVDAQFTADIAEIKEDYLKQADKTELADAISVAEAAAKAHADQKVADLVDGAPEALNTLNELAEALRDNKDIVTVLEQSIAQKANASDVETLTNTVSQNKTDADAAIKALQDRATALETADTNLLADIAELETSISNNTTAIATEKSRAEEAEAALEESITGVSEDLAEAVRNINEALAGKALATDLVAVEGRVTAVEGTLNTKVGTETFNEEIAELEQAIEQKGTDLTTYIEDRLAIEEGTTVKDYIDAAVGSGGTASAEAIAKAKAEAIAEAESYTDTQLSWQSYNPTV